MKTTKILLTALSLVALLTFVSFAAPSVADVADDGLSEFAASVALAETVSSGKCGTNLTWTLDDEGTLTISGSGDMTNWRGVPSVPWYSSRESIKKVVIGDGITSIGVHAFYYCTSLTSVAIPDSVTSIGNYAFCVCSSLTSVEIPDSVTSIGERAFNECTSLTSVEIPDSVTSIGERAFNECTSLTSVEIGASVESIGNSAFGYCSSLTSVEIGASVESIGNSAFERCTSLTSVSIGDSVTSIGSYAFNKCTSLTSVHITDIAAWCGISFSIGSSNPLYYAKNLYLNDELVTELVIPEGVTSIGNYAFYDCTSLTSVVIPDSVESIGGSAFSNCTSLTSVEIGNSVTSIGAYAFYYCTSLTSVEIGDSVTSIGHDAFYGCSSLTSIDIPDSVTSIGAYAFEYCTSLTSIEITDSVTSIGDRAFSICTSLTSITVDENNENYSSDERGVLFNKDKTTLIQYPVGNTATTYEIPDSVTSIGNCAFNECTALTSVDIPDSVTSIGNSAFAVCTSLTSVHITDIAAWCGISFSVASSNPLCYAENLYLNSELVTDLVIPEDVTSIGNYAFYYCTSLTSIDIPDSVTSIGEDAFSYCTSLTSIEIPDSVTSIGEDAFSYCSKLTSIEIPDSVTSVGNYAFSYCSSLTSVEIGDSVTSIGGRAFEYCTSLTSITVDENNEYYSNDERGVLFNKNKTTLIQYPIGNTATTYDIPDSVTSIGNSAFYGSISLTSVYIPDSVTSIGYRNRAFNNCPNLTIYGYSGSYAETYANANNIPFVALDVSEYSVSFKYTDGSQALVVTKTLTVFEDYVLTDSDVYDVEHYELPSEYQFLGWSEEANGTDYKTSEELRVSIKDLNGKTYYAQFEKVKHTYTVSFKFDTDMEALPTVTKTLSASEDYILTAADVYDVVHPEQPYDYEFIGWADSTDWLSSEELRVSIKDLDGKTYYAQFNEIQRHYLVFFLPNGGENGPDFQVKWEGEDITLTTDIPTRDGYEFVGWAKDPDATQAEYFPGDLYTADEFIYLYAVWKQIPVEYDVYVYSEPSQAWAYTRYNVTFTISLEGTYDGYSFTVPKTVDGLTITNVTANDGGYVDDMGEVYMISVLGGKMREDSAKLAVLTVEATVNADAPAGFVSLPLTNAMISNEMGEAAVSKCIVTPLEIKDRIRGDINDDGVFDYYDVSKIFALYRRKTTVPDYIDVDINRDGVFDYFDVSKLFAIYRGKASFN